VVQARRCHLGKVALGDPCVPVFLQRGECRSVVLILPKGVFVYDTLVTSVVKERGLPRTSINVLQRLRLKPDSR
jgi:hypothetical protein